jgi:hypothetical protein
MEQKRRMDNAIEQSAATLCEPTQSNNIHSKTSLTNAKPIPIPARKSSQKIARVASEGGKHFNN